jgi:hypothetical protein
MIQDGRNMKYHQIEKYVLIEMFGTELEFEMLLFNEQHD